MSRKNLYFYTIGINYEKDDKLKENCTRKDDDVDYLNKYYYVCEKEGSKWVILQALVPPGVNNRAEISTTTKRIFRILTQEGVKTNKFDNFYFGIHAADWYVIKTINYKEVEYVIPEDFSGPLELDYSGQIQATREFIAALKKEKYNFTDCRIKLFSHDSGTIWPMFTGKLDEFFTNEGQQKIFPFHTVAGEESAPPKEAEIRFKCTRLPTKPTLKELESLFFYFQVNLAALNLLNANDPSSELIIPILEKMKFLLEGGELEREWQEVLKSSDQPSLGNKHFVDVSKVLGIGHYLVVFGQGLKMFEESLAVIVHVLGSKDPTEKTALESLSKILETLKNQISETLKNKREELG